MQKLMDFGGRDRTNTLDQSRRNMLAAMVDIRLARKEDYNFLDGVHTMLGQGGRFGLGEDVAGTRNVAEWLDIHDGTHKEVSSFYEAALSAIQRYGSAESQAILSRIEEQRMRTRSNEVTIDMIRRAVALNNPETSIQQHNATMKAFISLYSSAEVQESDWETLSLMQSQGIFPGMLTSLSQSWKKMQGTLSEGFTRSDLHMSHGSKTFDMERMRRIQAKKALESQTFWQRRQYTKTQLARLKENQDVIEIAKFVQSQIVTDSQANFDQRVDEFLKELQTRGLKLTQNEQTAVKNVIKDLRKGLETRDATRKKLQVEFATDGQNSESFITSDIVLNNVYLINRKKGEKEKQEGSDELKDKKAENVIIIKRDLFNQNLTTNDVSDLITLNRLAPSLVIEHTNGEKETINSEERLIEVLIQSGKLSEQLVQEAIVQSDNVRSNKANRQAFSHLQSNANPGKRSLSFTDASDNVDVKVRDRELFSKDIVFDSVRIIKGQARRVKLLDLQALKEELGVSVDVAQYLQRRTHAEHFGLSWDSRYVEMGSYADYIIMLISILEALGQDIESMSGEKVLTACDLMKELASAVAEFEVREGQKTQINQAVTRMTEASQAFITGSLANRLLENTDAMKQDGYFDKTNKDDEHFLEALAQSRGVAGTQLAKVIVEVQELRDQDGKYSEYIQKLQDILKKDLVSMLRRQDEITTHFEIMEHELNAILLGTGFEDNASFVAEHNQDYDGKLGAEQGVESEEQRSTREKEEEETPRIAEERVREEDAETARRQVNLEEYQAKLKQWSSDSGVPHQIVQGQSEPYTFIMENGQSIMLVSQELLEEGWDGYQQRLANRFAIESDAQESETLKREMDNMSNRSMDDVLQTAMMLSKSFNFNMFGDFIQVVESFASAESGQLAELYRYESRYYYEALTGERDNMDANTWDNFVQAVVARGAANMSLTDEDFTTFLDTVLPQNSFMRRLARTMDEGSFISLVQALNERKNYEHMKNRFFKEAAKFNPEMYRPFREGINGISNMAAVNGTINNRQMVINDNFASLMELSLHC